MESEYAFLRVGCLPHFQTLQGVLFQETSVVNLCLQFKMEAVMQQMGNA